MKDDSNTVILMPETYKRLPLSRPIEKALQILLEAAKEPRKGEGNIPTEFAVISIDTPTDYLSNAMTCRIMLASQNECDGDSGKTHTSGTYAIRSPLYEKLASQRSGIITISGSMGSGKSLLLSQIAASEFSGADFMLLYFSFSAADYRRKSYKALLVSFILQLLYRDTAGFDSNYVRDVYSKMASGQGPTPANLFRLLCALLSTISGQTIKALGPVLDNSTMFYLDEHMKTVRDSILTDVFTDVFTDDRLQGIRTLLDEENATPLKATLIAALGPSQELRDRPDDYNLIYKQMLQRADAPSLWLEETSHGGNLTPQAVRVAAPKQLRDDLRLVAGSLIRIEQNVVYLLHSSLRELVRNDPSVFPQINDVTSTGELHAIQSSVAILLSHEIYSVEHIGHKNRAYDHICEVSASGQVDSFARYAGYSIAYGLDIISADTSVGKAHQPMWDAFSLLWNDQTARSCWIQSFATLSDETAGKASALLDKTLRMAV
ncbi:hypothetical protein GGR57DRAFT_510506 [Xylariaceae sp. FL1272]|nr:hypothetical protein GGR57DRAFT_510506 [Xylariaceae sp. FL1272]